jgi:hypothetical protein
MSSGFLWIENYTYIFMVLEIPYSLTQFYSILGAALGRYSWWVLSTLRFTKEIPMSATCRAGATPLPYIGGGY